MSASEHGILICLTFESWRHCLDAWDSKTQARLLQQKSEAWALRENFWLLLLYYSLQRKELPTKKDLIEQPRSCLATLQTDGIQDDTR